MKRRRFHAPPTARGRLNGRREALVYGVLGLVWLSGAAWLIVRYGLRASGEFGELPHPLEAWWMRLHGAAAMSVIWLGGLLWAVHIVPAWRAQRRISGIVLGAGLLALIISGYLLYYVGNEDSRHAIALAHWLFGLALPIPLLLHALRRRSRRQAAEHAPRHDRRVQPDAAT